MKKVVFLLALVLVFSSFVYSQTASQIIDKIIEGNDYISNISGKVHVDRSIDKPGVAKLFNFLRKKSENYDFYIADTSVDKNSKVSETIKGDAIYMVHKNSGTNPTWLSYVDSHDNKVSNWFYYKLGSEHLIPVSSDSKIEELGLDPLKIKKANKDRFNYKMINRGVGQFVIEVTPKNPESEQFLKMDLTVKEVNVQYPSKAEKFYYIAAIKGASTNGESISNWKFSDFIFAPLKKGSTVYKEDFQGEEVLNSEESVKLNEGEYLLVVPTKSETVANLSLNGKRYTSHIKVSLDKKSLAYNYSESEVESMFDGNYELLNKYLEKIRAFHYQK